VFHVPFPVATNSLAIGDLLAMQVKPMLS
jgi:hypothetical protein